MNNTTKRTLTPWLKTRWIWLTLFSLLAFAANSVLCRLALKGEGVDPETFTALRLLSGCAALAFLLRCKTGSLKPGGSWKGSVALFLYAYLFSIAYVQLEAGVGALVLFGAVQLTMFAASWWAGEALRPRVLLGMGLAFAGLLVLLLPGASAPPVVSSLMMVVSGMAWGAYSLLGKGSSNALGDTTGNFLRCLVLLLPLAVMMAAKGAPHASPAGVAYALGSGVVASGLGYAAWYSVLKHLSAQQAATLQLCVPVIASVGGVLLLNEAMTLRLGISSAVVLGGIALALAGRAKLEGPQRS